jgi:Bacterial capsule synthesis protein PGA_cap
MKPRAAFFLLALLALVACVPEDGGTPGATAPQLVQAGASGQCTGAPVFEAPPLNACGGASTRLAVVGDVLLHLQLQQLGYRIGFGAIWSQPARYLRAADIAVANVEGPVAPGITRARAQVADPGPVIGTEVYTGYPQFNYHPVVLRDLKAAGVDIVTTANNHAMDRGPVGVDLTLAEARKAGLVPLGTVARGQVRDFVHRRSSGAGTLSFIACSFSTNGIADPHRQVLQCYRDRSTLLGLVRREAADPAVAGVIVLPHWGIEYTTTPDASQRGLVRELVAAGATAVVGTHPHAVQPFTIETGPGGIRVPVVYSTGNFVATQGFVPSKYEAMALVDLCRGANGRAVAARAGWIAMQMSLSSRGYWVDIAPRGAGGAAGQAEAFLRKVAPGFSAQPAACGG